MSDQLLEDVVRETVEVLRILEVNRTIDLDVRRNLIQQRQSLELAVTQPATESRPGSVAGVWLSDVSTPALEVELARRCGPDPGSAADHEKRAAIARRELAADVIRACEDWFTDCWDWHSNAELLDYLYARFRREETPAPAKGSGS